jgi:hypothetical protein
MTTSPRDNSIADYYFDFLKNLDQESKPDLIAKLTRSLNEEKQKPDVSLQSLFGAYQSDETADEIIAAIRASTSQ